MTDQDRCESDVLMPGLFLYTSSMFSHKKQENQNLYVSHDDVVRGFHELCF